MFSPILSWLDEYGFQRVMHLTGLNKKPQLVQSRLSYLLQATVHFPVFPDAIHLAVCPFAGIRVSTFFLNPARRLAEGPSPVGFSVVATGKMFFYMETIDICEESRWEHVERLPKFSGKFRVCLCE